MKTIVRPVSSTAAPATPISHHHHHPSTLQLQPTVQHSPTKLTSQTGCSMTTTLPTFTAALLPKPVSRPSPASMYAFKSPDPPDFPLARYMCSPGLISSTVSLSTESSSRVPSHSFTSDSHPCNWAACPPGRYFAPRCWGENTPGRAGSDVSLSVGLKRGAGWKTGWCRRLGPPCSPGDPDPLPSAGDACPRAGVAACSGVLSRELDGAGGEIDTLRLLASLPPSGDRGDDSVPGRTPSTSSPEEYWL